MADKWVGGMDGRDQLTRAERIRLEALNQANQYGAMKHLKPEEVISAAMKFESFIYEAVDKREQNHGIESDRSEAGWASRIQSPSSKATREDSSGG